MSFRCNHCWEKEGRRCSYCEHVHSTAELCPRPGDCLHNPRKPQKVYRSLKEMFDDKKDDPSDKEINVKARIRWRREPDLNYVTLDSLAGLAIVTRFEYPPEEYLWFPQERQHPEEGWIVLAPAGVERERAYVKNEVRCKLYIIRRAYNLNSQTAIPSELLYLAGLCYKSGKWIDDWKTATNFSGLISSFEGSIPGGVPKDRNIRMGAPARNFATKPQRAAIGPGIGWVGDSKGEKGGRAAKTGLTGIRPNGPSQPIPPSWGLMPCERTWSDPHAFRFTAFRGALHSSLADDDCTITLDLGERVEKPPKRGKKKKRALRK